MGLGMSLATAFIITEGMKNLFGKPRPDLLSRCVPNTSRIEEFSVSTYGTTVDPRWRLVTWGICQQTDLDMLNDGFRSFPSGHSSCKRSVKQALLMSVAAADTQLQSPGPACCT